MTFKNRDIIAIADFTKEDLTHLLTHTKEIKNRFPIPSLKGKILGSCFFEPSTRTRLSFEAAMHRMDGKVIGFSDNKNISTAKGESLQDTLRMLERYVDIVVIRHPLEGAAQLAADTISIPVINAGDGAHQHPTQTFLDLFSIQESQGSLEKLHIAMVGDLKHSRTVHSLSQALIPFQTRMYFVSPSSLEMPKAICDELKEKGIKFSFHPEIEEIIHKLDILYMTRIQEERFSDKKECEMLKNGFTLKVSHFKNVKDNLKVLHPLPRVNEIDRKVDATPYAYYFQQAENGLYVRQALLSLILGDT